MRINIYSQELITDARGRVALHKGNENLPKVVEAITTKADGIEAGVTYSAVRLYLHSSERLHAPPQDDDRSALTFWLPRSAKRREALAKTFEALAAMVRAAPAETGLD